jgi:chromosome condensin MukBEF complex kleisin-like MukF subunit
VLKKGDSSYTVQADIFSFGVILFEMFHPPFSTYMERAETLTTLRGDKIAQHSHSKHNELPKSEKYEDFHEKANERFPKPFSEKVPENAQR